MNTKRQPRQPWLEWAQRLQAIAQTGLTFTENPFKVERYERVREIAAEMVAAQSEWAAQPILDLFADQAGYATPKVDVRGVLFDADGRLLLVQERRDGGWTLPGGWADVNDSPAKATEREIFEKSGYRARAVKLLACYDRNRHDHPRARSPGAPAFHIYKRQPLFFLCELEGGTPITSIETSDLGFFSEDEIPPLSLPRTTPAQIARFFEHYRHPEWATDFD